MEEQVITMKNPVQELLSSEALVVRHEQGKRANTINNRGFALLTENDQQSVVEVVRRGQFHTRIRRSLDGNTKTELVQTMLLEFYSHPVNKSAI